MSHEVVFIKVSSIFITTSFLIIPAIPISKFNAFCQPFSINSNRALFAAEYAAFLLDSKVGSRFTSGLIIR